MSKIEAQHYERKEMWKNYYNNSDVDKRALITVKSIPVDSQSVLDIGCGVGSITNCIIKPFVVGMDLARTPLKHVVKYKFQGSVNAIPIKSKSFDTVIITEVLEHLSDKLYEDTIKEIERLAPKYILVSVPYDQCLEADYCKCRNCGNIFNADHHYRSFKHEYMDDLFHGYSIINVTNIGKCIYPNKHLLKLKHRLGIYRYTDATICNKCGALPLNNKSISTRTLRIILRGLSIIDYLIKYKIFKNIRPTHQIVLFKRNEK